jgi:hypothetical protein
MSWYEDLVALPAAIFVSNWVYRNGGGDPDITDYSFWVLN